MPRPCRLLVYGIGSFASQFFVSEATISDMLHSHLKTVTVPDEVLLRRTVVVSEHLLIDVAEQVIWLYANVSAVGSALQQLQKFSIVLVWTLPLMYSTA